MLRNLIFFVFLDVISTCLLFERNVDTHLLYVSIFCAIFYIYNTYNIRQRKRKTNDNREDDQRGCRRKKESAEAEQQMRRRSREVATKMTYSEDRCWRPDRSVRRVVGTRTKCADVAPQARIVALSGRTIERIAILSLCTLYTVADQRQKSSVGDHNFPSKMN